MANGKFDNNHNITSGVMVAAINTAGGSYTCPSDGYIIGQVTNSSNTISAYVTVNDITMCNIGLTTNFPLLLFVKSGDVIKTRSNNGTYNLYFGALS